MLTELRLWFHELRIQQLNNAIAACEMGINLSCGLDDESYRTCIRMKRRYRKCRDGHQLAWDRLTTDCLPSHCY